MLRSIISDGKHKTTAFFKPDSNIEPKQIIKITKRSFKSDQQKKLVFPFIHEFIVLKSHPTLIGDPKQINQRMTDKQEAHFKKQQQMQQQKQQQNQQQQGQHQQQAQPNPQVRQPQPQTNQQQPQQQAQVNRQPQVHRPMVPNVNSNNQQQTKSPSAPKVQAPSSIAPISSLNMYNPSWTIKVRVTAKTAMKTWDKGESNRGKLFSFDVLDGHGGEIRIVSFKEAADKWYDYINIDSIYTISRGKLKLNQNKKYSSIKCDYEMTIDTNSVIQLQSEDPSISYGRFNLVSLEDLPKIEKDKLIDVVGVIAQSNPIDKYTPKSGNSVIDKRKIILADQKANVEVTLWGALANRPDLDVGKVMVIKQVKKSDFNKVSLGTVSSSSIITEPKGCAKAEVIQGWYAKYLENDVNWNPLDQTEKLTMEGSSGGTSYMYQDTIDSIRLRGYGTNGEAEFAKVRATITNKKNDSDPWYECCPNPDCKGKKVIKNTDGVTFTCPSCKQQMTECSHRYILNVTLGDYTGESKVMAFTKGANAIMNGLDCDVLFDMKQNNEENYTKMVTDVLFQTYMFTLLCKSEQWQGEDKVKMTVTNAVAPNAVDTAKSVKSAVQRIRAYEKAFPQ
ncbi:replication factor A1 [Acrasis kona]|uniref:Replication protein A subunit n=1 Tax=Acrasis kona TaxID=1008807 RepID=A0AAW2ZIM6_9EUKA